MADEQTARLAFWTCLSCGVIGDRQGCANCGGEAMPGRWVEEAEVARLTDALRAGKCDFDLIQRTVRNSRTAPNVFESLADFAKWGEEKIDAALARSADRPASTEPT